MREFVGRFGETIHRPQPLLFISASIAQICAMERADDWDRGCRSPIAKLAFALPVSRKCLRKLSGALLERCGLIVMSLIPSKRVDRISL